MSKEIVMCLFVLFVMAACNAGEKITNDANDLTQEEVRRTVVQIQQVECLKTDSVLFAEGLKTEGVVAVRNFCAMSVHEMTAEISARFQEANTIASGNYKTNQHFYTCPASSFITNIPNYADLGLTSSTCIWHDTTPAACRVEGAVSCLWGCNNIDPSLGWHTKLYASRSAVEADIFPKGYAQVDTSVEGGSYRRSLGLGYSYQVHSQSVDANGQGIWHNEGPEPDPRFSWTGYLGGWWPFFVQSWHQSC